MYGKALLVTLYSMKELSNQDSRIKLMENNTKENHCSNK